MESETPSPGRVKDGEANFDQNSADDGAGQSRIARRIELGAMALRINGYLRGAFARGARYVILDPFSIARTFAGYKPRSVAHIRRAITAFRRQSTAWRFDDIYYKPCARGATKAENIAQRAAEDRFRRHRRIKVTPAGGGHVVTQLEVSIRLIAYVAAAVKLSGRAHVDREFLRRFQLTSGCPAEWIALAWQRIKKIKGYRCRWRGQGNGRKLVVEPSRGRKAENVFAGSPSMQQNARRSSFPFGKEDQKQAARGAVTSQAGTSGEPAGSQTDGPLGDTPRTPSQAASDGTRPPPPANEPDHAKRTAPPPSGETDAPGARAGNAARLTGRPAAPPFEIAGRWVSSAKIERLAVWLAVAPMRAAHGDGEECRVIWRRAHACNFARRNLRNGHTAAAIVAAYARGVSRSHDDSLDRDRAQIDGDTRREPRREPSAAVVYAAAILGADTRSAEQRWRDFFAAPRAPLAAPARMPAKPRDPAAPPARTAAPRAPRNVVLEELRAKIAARPRPPDTLTLAELRAELGPLPLAAFNALPWREKQRIVWRALARKQNLQTPDGQADAPEL